MREISAGWKGKVAVVTLYRELRGTNVHVSVVKPGPVSTEFYDAAATQSAGLRIPAERFGVQPEAVVNRIWKLLRKPTRVVYVPRLFVLVPWVELGLGWLIDLLGPLLLRRQLKLAKVQVGYHASMRRPSAASKCLSLVASTRSY